MAEYHELYQQAIYYDIVFNRDVSREVDFVSDIVRHYQGPPLKSVLDIACGPGYHAREFARRGYRAVGLDIRPEMVAFAEDSALKEGLQSEWIEADMREFSLSVPVDVAFTMFDSIDCLQKNEEFVRHFCAVADNLSPLGLYIIDLTHPRDCSYGHYGNYRYSGHNNGLAVEIEWATNKPQFDWITGIARVDLVMRINEHGRVREIRDSAVERAFSAQEIQLLAELSGVMQVIGWHGDFDISQPFDESPASRRMIAVLQKIS